MKGLIIRQLVKDARWNLFFTLTKAGEEARTGGFTRVKNLRDGDMWNVTVQGLASTFKMEFK